MGDPETEVVIPRLQNDLVELFESVASGTLSGISVKTDPRTAVTVMLVSGGYPGMFEKGKVITGLDDCKGSLLFHAGTTLQSDRIVTSGGRVLAITTLAGSISEAVSVSMSNAAVVQYEQKYYRRDIGRDLM
jgi:phosphoribosylamine--glycine ligase